MGKKRKLPGPTGSNKKKTPNSKGPKPNKPNAHKGKGKARPQQHVPLPAAGAGINDGAEDHGDELEVSDEDLEFVQQYGAQLGFLEQLDTKELDRAILAKQKTAATAAAADDSEDDDGAAEYERRPRSAEAEPNKPSSRGLPVKTAGGELVFVPNQQQQRLLQASSSKVHVEGVVVQDTLQQEQQQQKQHNQLERPAAEDEEEEEAEEDGVQKAAVQQQQQQLKSAAARQQQQQGSLPPGLLSLMSLADSAARREALKQQMALAAQHLLAEPDKHIAPGLKLLFACAADADGVVVRLALLSLLAVFKDLLPGYRIRSLTDEEREMRVSKEVEALRDFESTLLKGYQAYLKTLLAAATIKPCPTTGRAATLATSRVAVRCMSQLLVAKPGFNYSSDLLQALVPLMVSCDSEVSDTATGAVQQLLREDVQGKTSLEAVQLVADLVRRKRCNLQPAVVNALLVLRFERVTPTSQGGEGVGRHTGKAKAKSKKSRKAKKSDLDRDLEEAEAGPDIRELELLQSQMLEALFEIFFRVLKHYSAATSSNTHEAAAEAADAGSTVHDSSSGISASDLPQPWAAAKVHRKFPLLQPVLSGLGRYAHLISVDYFNDLMAVLQELLAAGALPVRERLCVLLCALDVLRGQGEALTIDRRAFYNHLYQTLLLVPLQVLYEAFTATNGSSGSSVQQRQQQPGAVDEPGEPEEQLQQEVLLAMQAVRVSQQGWEAIAASSNSQQQPPPLPTSVLLLRCLEQQLLGVKQSDMGRLAAFVKRLAGLMLSSTPSEALGAACLLWRLVRRYPKLVCLLEWEGGAPVGGQQYEPHCADPSEAGALASALWELPLLVQHYHPHVAAAARTLLSLTPGRRAAGAGGEGGEGHEVSGPAGTAAGAAVVTGAAGPQQVSEAYEGVRRGGFRPAPVTPPGLRGGRGGGAVGSSSSKAGMAARAAAAKRPWCEELQQAVGQDLQQQQQLLGLAAAVQDSVQQRPKQKPQQKPKQTRQQQLDPSTQLQLSAAASSDEVDMTAVQQALQQQYRLNRQYQQNQQLRRELAVTSRKVDLFRQHLIEKRQRQG